jgi:opacity protein-like surface antigen
MNKQTLLAALLILAPLSAAQAAVYAGADLLLDSVDMKNTAPENYSESTIGPGIHLGDRFAFGAVELGYSTTRKTFQDTDLRFNRLTGDGIGYVPLGGMLNLLVTAGLSETNFGASSFTHKGYTQDNVAKTTRVATTLLHGNEFDWRAGTGFSFAFGNGYEFHVIGRYEPLAMRGLSNYALSMDTGFNIDLN